jgi:hypothetical protein
MNFSVDCSACKRAHAAQSVRAFTGPPHGCVLLNACLLAHLSEVGPLLCCACTQDKHDSCIACTSIRQTPSSVHKRLATLLVGFLLQHDVSAGGLACVRLMFLVICHVCALLISHNGCEPGCYHPNIYRQFSHTYMHTYIHTYIHTHIHTCIHTYIHAF